MEVQPVVLRCKSLCNFPIILLYQLFSLLGHWVEQIHIPIQRIQILIYPGCQRNRQAYHLNNHRNKRSEPKLVIHCRTRPKYQNSQIANSQDFNGLACFITVFGIKRVTLETYQIFERLNQTVSSEGEVVELNCYETEENILWQLFGPFGAVQNVKVP